MYSLLAKRGQMIAIAIGVLIVAAFLITAITGITGAGYSLSSDLNQIMKSNPNESFNFFDLGIYATVCLIALCAIAALFFGVFQVLTNLKGSVRGIIALAIIIGLFFVFYSTASDDFTGPLSAYVEKFNISSNISKLISAGLKTTLSMLGLSFVVWILLEIWNLIK